MQTTVQNLVVNSTSVARLRSLRDEEELTYLADANVTGTLKTASGTDVAGAVDLPMTYVAGTSEIPAEYRGTIHHTVILTLGSSYTFVVTAVSSDGASHREFNIPCLAVKG